MPVLVGEQTGVTRNVSVSGMYIEFEQNGDLGGSIEFEVEIEAPVGRMVMKCVGEVLRREHRAGRTGFAVKVIDSHLVPIGMKQAA